MNPESDSQDANQPVAYDAEGRPLYAAPPDPEKKTGHTVVHFSRAVDPAQPVISPEIQKKHEKSVKRFPKLNLSNEEYVINAVRRHPIGLFPPVLITILLVALIASGLANYDAIAATFQTFEAPNFGPVLLLGVLAIILVLAGGYIAIWVYLSNAFYLTNESVIQEIQLTLFARNEQTVSLSNIEDASYTQHGILQTMLNYGSIRLSTEGDETTYRFSYVYDPRRQIAILNNAVEAFKNGRPVETGGQQTD